MRTIKTLALTALLVGGFIYFTHDTPWSPRQWLKRGEARPAERLWTGPAVAQSAGLSADELNTIEIYNRANKATVNITTVVYRQNWFFEIVPQEGTGSGFLISAEGHILTNNHVVAGRRPDVTVTLADPERRTYKAQLVARDPGNDLALLRISPRGKLPNLQLGDSENLKIGQKVLAIGNPFALEGTLTTGVISALGRSIRGDEDTVLEDMIQTDAAINQGNSGGPLLDSQGNVIGINTAILGPANIGIGFAMPISRARVMLEEFQAKGRFVPPTVGVRTVFVTGDLAEALNLPREGGLLITQVVEGSPAEEAGLRGARRVAVVGMWEVPIGGDLIVALDGRPVDSDNALRSALVRKRPGDKLVLTIYRDGGTRKVTVTLGESRAVSL